MERFIIGTGRCGSTLLSKMLALSPEMASIFEFFNGLHGSGRFTDDPVTGAELWDIITAPHAFVTMVTSRGFPVEEVAYPFDRPGMRYGPSDELPWLLVATLPRLTDDPDRLFDEAHEFTLARPKQPRAQHYRELFGWLASKSGATLWNERSGSGIDYTADLAAIYPEARFLHLHRAGEEAALSMREHAAFRLAVAIVYNLDPELDLATALSHVVPQSGEADPIASFLERRPAPEHFGRFWADQLAVGYRAVKNLRPEQYLEVAFEDLVVSPAQTLGRIAEFFVMDPAADDWISKAAALVRGAPPARLDTLAPREQAAIVAACRTGNQLLGRSEVGRTTGDTVRKHSLEARWSSDTG